MKTHQLQQTILGTLMIDHRAFFRIEGTLNPHMFDGDNRKIAEAIWQLQQEARPYDEHSLNAVLPKIDITYLQTLADKFTNDLETVAMALRQKYLELEHEKLWQQGSMEIRTGEKDIISIATEVTGQSQLLIEQGTGTTSGIQDVLREVYDQYSQPAPSVLPGVPTGIAHFDGLTGGWQAGEFIVLGGRPGMGKTTLMLYHALTALQNDKSVVVFSLEMNTKQLTERIACYLAGVDYEKRHQATPAQRKSVADATHQIAQMDIQIFDTKSLKTTKVEDICIKMRAIHQRTGADLFCLDYLGLMDTHKKIGDRSTTEKVGIISNTIANTAKQLQVPILCLAQLSRAVEVRGGMRRPQLSDLKHSGDIEQDADTVIFPFRPEYYDIHETEDGQSTKGFMEWNLAKYRDAGYLTQKKFGLVKSPNGQLIDVDIKSSNESLEYSAPITAMKNINNDDIPF